jgi:Tfp pilus assembly protein FimT
MTSPHFQAPLRRVARDRTGATLIELAIVVIIMGVLAALTIPRFSNFIAAIGARSAASEVVSDISTARMTAVREGRTTSLTVNGTSTGYTLVVENTDGSVLRTLRAVSLTSTYNGTTITGDNGNKRIAFDSRGLLKTGSTAGVTLKRGSRSQHLTISSIGRVIRDSPQ